MCLSSSEQFPSCSLRTLPSREEIFLDLPSFFYLMRFFISPFPFRGLTVRRFQMDSFFRMFHVEFGLISEFAQS